MKFILTAGIALLAAAPLSARPLTAQDLVGLRRLSGPVVSPDGHWAVYQLRETDLGANRGRTDLWKRDLTRADATPTKLAALPDADEGSPAFGKDGRVYFLSDQAGGKNEIWSIDPAGGDARQVTSGGYGIDGFRLSPTGGQIVVWAERPVGARTLADTAPAADPMAGSAHTADGLFARHWDSWADGRRKQLFTLPLLNGVATGAGTSVMGALIGDAPSAPYGGAEEVAWSRDGATLYFALREAGRIEPTSTNLDIFSVPADGSAAPTNLTADNKGTDNLPAVSPDGRWLAWGAMARPGYEADRMVVKLREIATGRVRVLTGDWDRSAESIDWSADGKRLYVTTHDHFDRPIFAIDVASGKIERLTGEGSVNALAVAGDRLIYAADSLTAPADLFVRDARGRSKRLTAVNADKLAGIDMPVAERFSFAGAQGDKVWGFVVKPAAIAAGAKAPIAMLVHGGPQGTFGNGWSYRWNPAIFAGAGYGAVLVDFHGSTGYGQAFTDAINKDWGGKPLVDLKAGLAAATAKFGWLDANNACALGGSYGGYMMNWIQGAWSDGFKCLVDHAGVFDARAMAYETDELWFDEWEHGGPYFEQTAEYEKWNPATKVGSWKTPMLVTHGEKDFRIPYTQGLASFTALQRREIPSRLVVFPDENHWILKPKNSLQWHKEVFDWLGRWTGGGK